MPLILKAKLGTMSIAQMMRSKAKMQMVDEPTSP